MVRANRDMLVAVAGVFFLLPELIGAVVLPVPQLTKGMDQQQMADAVLRFYSATGPLLIVLSLPLVLGFLIMLAMLIDPDRPTVGTAIVQAARLLPGYMLAQMIIAVVLTMLWVTAIAGLSLVLPQTAAVAVSLVLMVYPLVRVMLIGPEMVARRLRNPIRAITGALALTRGKFTALLLFFGPALALFVVVYALISIGTALALANLANGEIRRLIGEAVGAILLAVGHTYFAAMVASTWYQLGPVDGADATISPFTPR
jgi:hypothetical protein